MSAKEARKICLGGGFVVVSKGYGCVNESPVACLDVDPDNPIAGLSVTFNATGSYDPDGSGGINGIFKFEWDINYDGDNFTPEYSETYPCDGIATHTYTVADSYTVMLRVTDGEGARDTTTRTFDVGNVIYVDVDSYPFHDGTTWVRAFVDLQDALDIASNGNEIWVADGTYEPTDDTDRTISFELVANIGVYGGFEGNSRAGGGETERSQRDWANNETILSGDIDGSGNNDSYNVVVGAAGATVDGFTITKGYADHASTAQYQSGGGMYNSSCSPTVTNCIFDDNYAKYGGGMYNTSSSPTVTNCSFTDNEAIYWGGGMENTTSSSTTITRCVFAGNAVTATNYGGGAIDCYSNSNADIINCTISKNTAANGYAGGLCSNASSPTINSTIFWDNTDAYSDLDLVAATSGTITLSYSNVTLSYYGFGGSATASYCIFDTNPLFADAGSDDFHLKSAGGRWDPAASDWTEVGDDTTTSPCINTGDSSSSYSNEPTPNGSRINMGFYGNTTEASKSGYGSLKVNLTPITAQWRLMGSGTWNDSGDSIVLVSRGSSYSYTIEFKAHLGYDTPSPLSGINIYPEQETVRNVTYDVLTRYIDYNSGSDSTGDGSALSPWRTIDYSIHRVDAGGGGNLHFALAYYTEMLESSDFYDLNYMTNCYETSQDPILISASESVFPSQHVSFTAGFLFDQ